MSERPELFLCKKCGSEIDIFANIDFDEYSLEFGEDGAVTVKDVRAFIDGISLIECGNPDCDAQWEETGWKIILNEFAQECIVPVGE